MREVIGDSTKKDAVLKKAVLPRKNYKSNKKETKNGSPKRNRSNSRSRSRSPRRRLGCSSRLFPVL